jgi:hypothetical protein
MAATPGFAVTWVWLLLMGGVSAVPLGGAPLPLDPVLSSLAPEECLWYASYAGQGEADPESKNQTEQLFAEPQVERFVEHVQSELMQAVRRAGGPEREKRVLAAEAPKLVRALLTRPFAAYVEEVKPKDGGIDAAGAFVLNAGDQKAEVKAAIEKLIELLPPEHRKYELDDVAEGPEGRWHRLLTPPNAPGVRFGWKDEYFIIAVGDETPQTLFKRMEGPAPKWLTAIRDEHPIERELSLGYVNMEGILQRLRPIVEEQDAKAWPVIEKLGLTHIRAIHGVSGYDAEACTSVGHIVTDGERRGLLGLLPHRPLEAGDLQPIPKDALFAVAATVDLAEVWDHALDLATSVEPRAKEDVARALWEAQSHLGVDLREDLVGSLDDAVVVYVPGGELMVSWLNATVALRVKDRDQLSQAVEKLVDAAKAEMGRHGDGTTIGESELGDHTLYTLHLARPAPIAPSVCVGDDWLVLSLSPLAVRTTLQREKGNSLAEADVVSNTLKANGGAAAIAYQDTPRLVESLYPWVQIGVQMASGSLRQAGIEIDPTLLPEKEVVLRHLSPSIATLRHAADGFHVTSNHSLPGGGNLAAAAPVGAALLLPAVHSARGAAQSVQSMNNMKQIALAIHNYHATHTEIPTDIYDEDGKPLLSWRVRVLPFLEQQALYEQLKLDEPWDSEHNRRLTSESLPVYASPGAPADGKTRYLAFTGEGTAMPGKEALSFKDITDGMSNTIAVVEAGPDRAVPWAKPADIDFDADKPREGLPANVNFPAAFWDGSVRQINTVYGADIIKALITHGGGEGVSYPPDRPPGQ